MKNGTKFTYGGSRYVFDRMDGANWIAHPVEAAHQVFSFTAEHQAKASNFEEPPKVEGPKAMSRDLLRALRAEIDAAVKAIGERHGVSMTTGSCSFMTQTATFKLLVGTLGEGGEAIDPRFGLLAQYAKVEGLRPEHLDPAFRFRVNGKQARLVGYNPRGRRMPFLFQYEGDAGTRKCARSFLLSALNLKASPFDE